MKFIRLRIANYRGIMATEVNFASNGITLIQGPNEIGKTSLGESIGLLFEFPDSSKRRDVEAIRPVHWDEGPEIELQAESGPYAFTYFKRYYKKPETKLTITKPKPENLTGREAHDRAEIILRETLDINLWKALIVQQGDAIKQPFLTGQTSLSAALDKVAGGRPSDPREEGLYDKVRGEYTRYYTENGTERKELKGSRRIQMEAQTGVTKIEQAIRELESDIERAANLQRELGQLKHQEEGLIEEVAIHVTSLEAIRLLESALNDARLKLETAQKSELLSRQTKDARQCLIDAVAKSAKAYADNDEISAMSLPALNHADEELKNAQAAYNETNQKRIESDSLAFLYRADFDYYTAKLNLEQIQERKERIDQARKDASQAEDILASARIDDHTLDVIKNAERDLIAANARLEVGAPNVSLRGLIECHLSVDDIKITLGKGEVRTISVEDSLRFTIPGTLDVEITAGSGIEALSKQVKGARRVLDSACAAAGVSGPDEARKAYEEWREALRKIEIRSQVEKEALRDLTYDQLVLRLHGLQQSVPNYLTKRQLEPAIPPDLDSAKEAWACAEVDQGKVNSEWEAAREALDIAVRVRENSKIKHQEGRIQLDLLANDLRQSKEDLEKAREKHPDDVLELNLDEAVRIVGIEEDRIRSAEMSLREQNPDRIRTLAETAKDSLQTTKDRRSAAQTELTEVQTRLKIHGEEGLHEKLHAAQIYLERIEYENQALLRRATAARFLLETIAEERDKVRLAYVTPLKEKIEHLGRLVFDDSFQVEINEELQITDRTVNGITVPFDSLSGGTREQVALIFRLACSIFVAKEGGTPLILDDVLGYTDAVRLRSMGAVLAKAAKECQIIIFTCVPERYGNIGTASVVSL